MRKKHLSRRMVFLNEVTVFYFELFRSHRLVGGFIRATGSSLTSRGEKAYNRSAEHLNNEKLFLMFLSKEEKRKQRTI